MKHFPSGLHQRPGVRWCFTPLLNHKGPQSGLPPPQSTSGKKQPLFKEEVKCPIFYCILVKVPSTIGDSLAVEGGVLKSGLPSAHQTHRPTPPLRRSACFKATLTTTVGANPGESSKRAPGGGSFLSGFYA